MSVREKEQNCTVKYSAILVVETKEERIQTIKEYEKQRDILRKEIAR